MSKKLNTLMPLILMLLLPAAAGAQDQLVAGKKPQRVVTLQSLVLVPPAAIAGGCQTLDAKVRLTGRAPSGGVTVMMVSTNTAASVPATVVLPAGASSKTFSITTSSVGATQTGIITATYENVRVSKSVVIRPVGVRSLTINREMLTGGESATGVVKLECSAASEGGTMVRLSTSNAVLAGPALSRPTIPAGQASATFTINAAQVKDLNYAYVRATTGKTSKNVKLTIKP